MRIKRNLTLTLTLTPTLALTLTLTLTLALTLTLTLALTGLRAAQGELRHTSARQALPALMRPRRRRRLPGAHRHMYPGPWQA